MHKSHDLPPPTTWLEEVMNVFQVLEHCLSPHVPILTNFIRSIACAMVHVEEPVCMSEHAFGEACRWWLRRTRQVDWAGTSVRLGGEVWLNPLITTYHISRS